MARRSTARWSSSRPASVPTWTLAVEAGLQVRRGIVVGDDLTCEGVPDVCAIGECAEHRGRVYGLVAPLWEQAHVLADRLSGKNPQASYTGSKPSTKLKVAGVELAVMGDKDPIEEDDEVVTYAEPSRGVYKKLVVRNNRLAGAIVIGDGAIVPSLLRLFGESSAHSREPGGSLAPRPPSSRRPPQPFPIPR